jgi:hypothetical protein
MAAASQTILGVTADYGAGAVPMNIISGVAGLSVSAIAWLVIPTGLTATFVTTFSGTMQRMTGHPLTLSGYRSAAPVASAYDVQGTAPANLTIGTTLDLPAGSLAVSMITKNTSSAEVAVIEGAKMLRATGATESMRTTVAFRETHRAIAGHRTVAQMALSTHFPASIITAVWK